MKKRITSLLLVLAMCFAMLPTAAFAVDDGGSTMPAYSGGSGTQDAPWLISSVEDLQTLASTINSGNAAKFDANAAADGKSVAGNYYDYYFKQTTDLDLSSIENWDPIGYSGGQNLYFAGHYDGDGHTISNAKSTGKKDTNGFSTAGVFGWVAFGSVKNLTVKNADFLATGDNNMSYVGGVLAVADNCTVENCSVYNSKIESRREPNDNSNYAGGITGIALTSSFEKCASVGNTIRHGSFGGGFIGALDKNNSNFTNCYVANCIVTGCIDTAANATRSGGFQSASFGANAILNNCFVYDCAAQPDTTSKGNDYFGVFTANTQYGKIVATSCFYYDANNATVNADSAESKTSEEFTDGTVANLLGGAFAQGKLYPVFATDPADYTEVDAAIAKVNALNKDNYKDFSAVEAAVNAVVRDKNITEQSKVDAMAKAIEDAEIFIREGKYDSAFDRVHTAFHGYLRKKLDILNEPYVESDTLNQLYNKLHTYVGTHIATDQSGIIKTTLRSASGIISSINDLRNRNSLAHPNNSIITSRDAELCIKIVKDLTDYIEKVI